MSSKKPPVLLSDTWIWGYWILGAIALATLGGMQDKNGVMLWELALIEWDIRSEISQCWNEYEKKSNPPGTVHLIAARCEALETKARGRGQNERQRNEGRP